MGSSAAELANSLSYFARAQPIPEQSPRRSPQGRPANIVKRFYMSRVQVTGRSKSPKENSKQEELEAQQRSNNATEDQANSDQTVKTTVEIRQTEANEENLSNFRYYDKSFEEKYVRKDKKYEEVYEDEDEKPARQKQAHAKGKQVNKTVCMVHNQYSHNDSSGSHEKSVHSQARKYAEFKQKSGQEFLSDRQKESSSFQNQENFFNEDVDSSKSKDMEDYNQEYASNPRRSYTKGELENEYLESQKQYEDEMIKQIEENELYETLLENSPSRQPQRARTVAANDQSADAQEQLAPLSEDVSAIQPASESQLANNEIVLIQYKEVQVIEITEEFTAKP